MSTNPLLTEFRAEIMRFEEVNQSVEKLPSAIEVGPLLLLSENIKASLAVEIKAWNVMFIT